MLLRADSCRQATGLVSRVSHAPRPLPPSPTSPRVANGPSIYVGRPGRHRHLIDAARGAAGSASYTATFGVRQAVQRRGGPVRLGANSPAAPRVRRLLRPRHQFGSPATSTWQPPRPTTSRAPAPHTPDARAPSPMPRCWPRHCAARLHHDGGTGQRGHQAIAGQEPVAGRPDARRIFADDQSVPADAVQHEPCAPRGTARPRRQRAPRRSTRRRRASLGVPPRRCRTPRRRPSPCRVPPTPRRNRP